jgi:anti-sigma B factor antagonist
MEITLSLTGDIPVFHLNGRLDMTTSPLLEERLKPLLTEPGQKLVFDCAELTYISSAGLRVFFSTMRHLTAEKGGVVFARLSPPVADLFRLAGLEDLFLISPTLEEAASKLLPGREG